MANALRGLNATVGATNQAAPARPNMGEELFYAPSVFSYFSPQSRTEKGLFGPEFQIYSTQTAANRADTVNTLLYGTLGGVKVNLTPFVNVASDTTKLTDYVSYVFLHSSMSAQLQSAVLSAVNAASTPRREGPGSSVCRADIERIQVIQ